MFHGKQTAKKKERQTSCASIYESSVDRLRVPSSPHQKTNTSDHQPMGGLVLFFKPLGLSFIVQCLLKTSDIKTPDNNRFHRAPCRCLGQELWTGRSRRTLPRSIEDSRRSRPALPV